VETWYNKNVQKPNLRKKIQFFFFFFFFFCEKERKIKPRKRRKKTKQFCFFSLQNNDNPTIQNNTFLLCVQNQKIFLFGEKRKRVRKKNNSLFLCGFDTLVCVFFVVQKKCQKKAGE
jgi:hypothetical protein